MLRKASVLTTFIVATCLALSSSVSGRIVTAIIDEKTDIISLQAEAPAYGSVGHRIGKMVLCVSNNGTFGTGFASSMDFFTEDWVPSCEYPKGSNTRYLYAAAFWIGAVVDRDTLVSMGATGWSWAQEFAPDEVGLGEIVKRSLISIEPSQVDGAISEEDYVMVYTDTLTDGVAHDISGRPHIPLNIEVTQASYAWSYSYAEDFILFDYTVRNIGTKDLENVYMGIYVDADVYFGQSSRGAGYIDDVCGFVETLPADYQGCQFWDTVNIAWIADNDGDPVRGVFTDQSVPNVTGTRIVRTPSDVLDVSFNWWISNRPSLDFGPRERSGVGRLEEEFREFGTGGLGTPVGDANAYYQMRNMEFDYDQVYTATIPVSDTLWLPPFEDVAGTYADGFDTRYLLSFGPFEINPGERLPISFAYVAGADFHQDPTNLRHLPYEPDAYYNNINFSDLGLNAAWAGRIYDNPGLDTDGDGYAGKVRICCNDSMSTSLESIEDTSTVEFYDPNTCELIWYEGDGVPDFQGASPPPGPDFWLQPDVGSIRVRINGLRSETTKDVFSRLADFEGYRVYLGRDDRESSYSLVGSYDLENYNKYVWTGTVYQLFDIPYTRDSLQTLYGFASGQSEFNPLLYPKDAPFFFMDSVFYFVKQDFNTYEFGTRTPIRKIYPDQPYPPSLDPDSASADELTEDGYFKYFEYEFEIEDLLPTVIYWVNVTAFDFGSPKADLKPLESSVTIGAKSTYPNTPISEVAANNLKAYIYPNPYRSDADYRDASFEGRGMVDHSDDRVRAIHFCNLPAKCTIRVFSLDGDLIRELEHDSDPNDPSASHEVWNMVTRNTQMVVSGIYYWTVESTDGTVQTGKLVIIM